jgi:nucleoside-diphosphate-sugar epimerase
VDETTPPRPVTEYGESKVAAEQGLAELASDTFCIASLRNATAFGYSPHLRLDLVVNDLVAGAVLRGEVRLSSDGMAWRPIVHVRDIARAFALSLDVPAARMNGRIFNVGGTAQNYRVIDIARAVARHIPAAHLILPPDADADRRSYRVRFELVRRLLPGFRCTFDLESGIAELEHEYRRARLRNSAQFTRLAHLRGLLAERRIDDSLRFRPPAELEVA